MVRTFGSGTFGSGTFGNSTVSMARTFGSDTFGSGAFGGSTVSVLPGYGVSVYGVDSYGATSVLVTSLFVVSTGVTTISLAWTAAGGTAPITFTVQRGTSSAGPFTTVVTGLTALGYTVTGLSAASTYWFEIIATDATGTTSTSSAVSGITSTSPPAPSVLPSVICELSVVDPTRAPQWTDITRYLKSFSTKRGRNFELDRTEAGTATVVLDNSDGSFNPLNTSGAFYGSLKRYRRIRLRAFWNNSFYPIFNGFITQLPETILSVTSAEAPISLSDGFAALAQCQLNITYGVEHSGSRIWNVLDAALWTTGNAWILGDVALSTLGTTTLLGPIGDRTIELGESIVDTTPLINTSALQHVQDVQTTEDGWTFVSADGVFVFYGRNRRTAQANFSTIQTFGDRPGLNELMYADVVLSDDVPIYNTVQVTRSAAGSTPHTAQDDASRASYFVQSLPIQSLLSDEAAAAGAAAYYVSRYKESKQRVATLVLDGTGSPSTLWPQILGREIADPITVRVRPPGSSLIEQPSWIEGIEHTWTAEGGDWLTQWHLSPIDQTKYWILGASALGTQTVLGIF